MKTLRSLVPALAALLGDEKLAAHARSGLENIKDPVAGEALLNALPQLKGQLLTGAVTSLGVCKEKTAVPALIKIAINPKHEAAVPALASLAQIGSDDAFQTILETLEKGPRELRIPSAHAALVCAKKAFAQERVELGHVFLNAIRKADLPEHFLDAAKAISAKYPGRI